MSLVVLLASCTVACVIPQSTLGTYPSYEPIRAPPPVYVQNVIYVTGTAPPAPATPPPPPPLPRSPRDVVDDTEELPPFDPQAARAALNRVDVSECRHSAGPRGFGHAKVTVNPDGRISKVVVDEPAGLSTEAAHCIGSRLGAITVNPFRGSAITMGTTYHVR